MSRRDGSLQPAISNDRIQVSVLLKVDSFVFDISSLGAVTCYLQHKLLCSCRKCASLCSAACLADLNTMPNSSHLENIRISFGNVWVPGPLARSISNLWNHKTIISITLFLSIPYHLSVMYTGNCSWTDPNWCHESWITLHVFGFCGRVYHIVTHGLYFDSRIFIVIVFYIFNVCILQVSQAMLISLLRN